MKNVRPGFASLTAIVLIGLVGVTLAMVGGIFIAQAKRTRGEAVEAQLRQMLVAGTVLAMHDVQSSASGEHALAIPKELADDGAVLISTINRANDSATVEFDAKLDGREMKQTLRFEYRDQKWKLVDALLGGDHVPASTQPSERSTAASQRS